MGAEHLRVGERRRGGEMLLERDLSLHAFPRLVGRMMHGLGAWGQSLSFVMAGEIRML